MSEHAIENGKGWLASVVEMIDDLNHAEAVGDSDTIDACRSRIDESPLSVTVRGGWHVPGDAEAAKPEEYEILLSTGGPALRLYGQLDEYMQPDDWPRLQWQDWGTPWTNCEGITGEEREALVAFARCFYFGE